MKRRGSIFPVLLFCLCWGLFFPAAHAYRRSHLLEEHAGMVIRLSNGAAFMKAIAQSPMGKLWNSPQMKMFRNNQDLEETLIRSIFLDSEPKGGGKEVVEVNRKILSRLRGEAVMGFNLHDGTDKPAYYVLVGMTAEDFKQLRDLFTLESRLKGEKVVSHQTTFREVEMFRTTVSRSGGEEGRTDWMAFCGGTFINGTKREWVESCIARLKVETPETVSGPPELEIWLPEGSLSRLTGGAGGGTGNGPGNGKGKDSKPARGPDFGLIMKVLGIEDLGKVSLRWTLLPDQSKMSLSLEHRPGQRKSGIWRAFAEEPVPRNHYLSYVPEEVVSYQVVRPDLQGLWEELPAILQRMSPETAAQFQGGVAMTSQMLGIDINRDIVRNLDTLLTTYSVMEGLEERSLYAWQLRDAEKMERVLAKLFAENGRLRLILKEHFELLDLGGLRVYSVKIPRMQAPAEEGQKPGLIFTTYAVCVVKGDLAFGTLDVVRSYAHGARGSGPGSKDSAGGRKFYRSSPFTEVIRYIPDRASGYGFVNVYLWLKPVANFLKGVSRLPSASREGGGKSKKEGGAVKKRDSFETFVDKLRFDRLPSPEFISSFFGPVISYFLFERDEFLVKWEFHYPVSREPSAPAQRSTSRN